MDGEVKRRGRPPAAERALVVEEPKVITINPFASEDNQRRTAMHRTTQRAKEAIDLMAEVVGYAREKMAEEAKGLEAPSEDQAAFEVQAEGQYLAKMQAGLLKLIETLPQSLVRDL